MSDNQEKIKLAIDLLRKFNRKERYHLLCDAVVGEPFRLKGPFLKKINEELDYPIPDSEDVYVAMDYHLDWIASAIHLINQYYDAAKLLCWNGHDKPLEDKKNKLSSNYEHREEHAKKNLVVTGNQADVDLLVAYERNDKLVLVMIEAKLESGWDGKQLRNKGGRLQEIFGDRSNTSWIVPRMILAGPNASEKVPNFYTETLNDCPDWFFAPETPKGKRENKLLRRIDLMSEHALYQPARKTNKGHKWLIRRTWLGKNSGNE